jgi:hypothetical protein
VRLCVRSRRATSVRGITLGGLCGGTGRQRWQRREAGEGGGVTPEQDAQLADACSRLGSRGLTGRRVRVCDAAGAWHPGVAMSEVRIDWGNAFKRRTAWPSVRVAVDGRPNGVNWPTSHVEIDAAE